MKSWYHRVEQAILFDYVGIPRPAALRDLDVNGDSTRRRGPVRVVPPAGFASDELAVPNAVARIALSSAQGRLPQWAAVCPSGDVLLARERWQRDPQPVPLAPQFLFQINWADSGPGISWPESYSSTFLPGFDRYVVTASSDSTDSWGYTDIAIGWFPDTEEWHAGCKRVITGWWRSVHGEEWSAWEELVNSGAVPSEDAWNWREETWFALVEDA